jgi:hypothetical protein
MVSLQKVNVYPTAIKQRPSNELSTEAAAGGENYL